MSNLEFLEVSQNFKSYYRTLRDVHYYLTNDSEVSQEELQAVSKVLSKLIYGFIPIKGTSFREMDREQFELEFNLFHQDFLNVIKNSGENNVEFDQFTALIDEIIGIAVKRTIALGKIKKVKQELFQEDEETVEVTDAESEASNEAEDYVTEDEVVDDEIEAIDELEEALPEVETPSTLVRTFSTSVETDSNQVEVTLYKIEKVEDEQSEPDNQVVVAEVVNKIEVADVVNKVEVAEVVNKVEVADVVNKVEVADVVNKVEVADVVNKVEVADVMPKKVKNNYVDAAPVVNNFKNNESGDDFRFRPRRRRK